MPRFAIKQARALHTIYRDADDALDAVNMARLAFVEHARHGELHVARMPDKPYDERDARSELRYEETDADRESEQRERERLFEHTDSLSEWPGASGTGAP